MKRTTLTVIAMCATLLWAGAVHASNAGGLPACKDSLNLCDSNLLTCDGSLSTSNNSLSTCDGSLSTCNSKLTTCTNELSAAQLCGNDVIDSGEQCDQGNLNNQTCASQGFVGGTLKCGANCQFDTSGCTNTRYTDNTDGTVTDHQTGLMWEKKTGTVGTTPATPDVHDVNNAYNWSTGDNLADGTAFTSFLARLNNGASTDGGAATAITGCFTNHCDWRLPSIVELQGIVDTSVSGCGSGNPCIDPIFGPTPYVQYWSATIFAGSIAWIVGFGGGGVYDDFEGYDHYVRAVRSGL